LSITIDNVIFIGSILLFISVILGKTSYKFGIPTLVIFLFIGMLAGSEGIGGIKFDSARAAQFIGVIALNIILFSGGLDTRWQAVKPVMYQGILLSSVGVMLTAGCLGAFVYFITDFTLYESLLLGSIVSSTDAAAVFSILRSKSLRLKENLRPTLEFESGSNDPMAYVLTIIFLTLVVNEKAGFMSMVPVFFMQIIFGGIMGFAFGYASKFIINKIHLALEGLYPVLFISLMFLTYSLTGIIGGNGYLAVYVCGLFLGNSEIVQKDNMRKIFDGFAWMMQIALFLTLGLLVYPSHLVPIFGVGCLISAFLIFVARPIAVWLCLGLFRMSKERLLYISWVGLRGAVPIVFATYPLLAGIEQATTIFNIVFFVSLTSVLIQGTTLGIVAKYLKMAEKE